MNPSDIILVRRIKYKKGKPTDERTKPFRIRRGQFRPNMHELVDAPAEKEAKKPFDKLKATEQVDELVALGCTDAEIKGATNAELRTALYKAKLAEKEAGGGSEPAAGGEEAQKPEEKPAETPQDQGQPDPNDPLAEKRKRFEALKAVGYNSLGAKAKEDYQALKQELKEADEAK